jgi:trehalose-6-phosphate synthase
MTHRLLIYIPPHTHTHTQNSVLVYSEFAGCSTDFKGALIINPYDSDKVAESIHVALTMSSTTKQVSNLCVYICVYV